MNPPEGETNYISDSGIPSLAKASVSRQDIVAPYAAFPVLLADQATGAVWLRHMLSGPRVMGPYGTTEGVTIDGKRITPVMTWDGKGTLALSLMGSTPAMRLAMRRAGVYEKFLMLVGQKYRQVFGENLEGESLAFRTPSSWWADDAQAFQEKAGPQSFPVGTWLGGGPLFQKLRKTPAALSLSSVEGYVWGPMPPQDLKSTPYLLLSLRTKGGTGKGLFLEIKNTDDELMTHDKLRAEFPDTGGKFQSFCIDLRPHLVRSNTRAALFVYSDPDVPVDISSVEFADRPQAGGRVMVYDGRRLLCPRNSRELLAKRDATNLLNQINFVAGGLIHYFHDHSLSLDASEGWMWARLPQSVDLNKNPVLSLVVKSYEEATIWLELRNGRNKSLLGTSKRFGIPKVPMKFPNTHGVPQTIRVSLGEKLLSPSDSMAAIIAFSDPGAKTEIVKMAFSPLPDADGGRPLALVKAAVTEAATEEPALPVWSVSEPNYRIARKDMETMKEFMMAYLSSKGYEVANYGWLEGFAPWYTVAKVGPRPYEDFLHELGDQKLQALAGGGYIRKKEPA